MYRKIDRKSVRSLVALALEEYAEEAFPELMTDDHYREDALQEIQMALAFIPQTTPILAQCATLGRRLVWLSHELGASQSGRPDFEKPEYEPLGILVMDNTLALLSDLAEEALERDAAA